MNAVMQNPLGEPSDAIKAANLTPHRWVDPETGETGFRASAYVEEINRRFPPESGYAVRITLEKPSFAFENSQDALVVIARLYDPQDRVIAEGYTCRLVNRLNDLEAAETNARFRLAKALSIVIEDADARQVKPRSADELPPPKTKLDALKVVQYEKSAEDRAAEAGAIVAEQATAAAAATDAVPRAAPEAPTADTAAGTEVPVPTGTATKARPRARKGESVSQSTLMALEQACRSRGLAFDPSSVRTQKEAIARLTQLRSGGAS